MPVEEEVLLTGLTNVLNFVTAHPYLLYPLLGLAGLVLVVHLSYGAMLKDPPEWFRWVSVPVLVACLALALGVLLWLMNSWFGAWGNFAQILG